MVKDNENLLDDEISSVLGHPNRIRKYAWDHNSHKLSRDKLTTVNDITVYYMPGSAYHAIITTLLHHANQFYPWSQLIEDVKNIIIQHKQQKAWSTFVNKKGAANYKSRIRKNAHILTRRGKTCFGYRLHKTGCGIYLFKDGALLKTGGKLEFSDDGNYDVHFPDGSTLQKRYRGRILTYKEYLYGIENNYLSTSCEILNVKAMNAARQNKLVFGMPISISSSHDAGMVQQLIYKLRHDELNTTAAESEFLLHLLESRQHLD